MLQGYGNLKNATISLVSHLRGGEPSSTQPSSYKHTMKTWIFTPLESKAETSEAKHFFGSAFIVEHSAEPPTIEVEYPHVYGSAFIYQQKCLICHFNRLWPSTFALRKWVNKTWSLGHELFFCSKGFFIVNFSTEAHY